MCGIAGIIGDGSASDTLLDAMADALLHRGPDDRGIWSDPAAGVGLAHRRLSIVDLSPMGRQPMRSSNGRFVLSYNGEIYNHAAIRDELNTDPAVRWRGHSDTETLIEAISVWGVRDTLDRLVGMFAFALWDRHERKLILARDRFGEKPLYYGWVGGDFLFGSELKALKRHRGFANTVDRRALRQLTARAYIPAPFSIYEGIFKLGPGEMLTADARVAAHPSHDPPTVDCPSPWLRIERYWSHRQVVLDGLDDPFDSEAEAIDALEESLKAAITGQSVADVSVGAFLSGGVDSSTVVGLYQAHAPGRVKTFTIGFEDAAFDEAVHARRVAAHYGTIHTERIVSVADAQAVIPLLPTMYDEPFADSSQIPTFLVTKLAREQVTVALSGDGGDELFGGYNRYVGTARTWDALGRLPRGARGAVGGALASIPPAVWNALTSAMPRSRRPAHFGSRVQKAFRTIRDVSTFDELTATFLDEWHSNENPVLGKSGSLHPAEFHLDLGDHAPNVTRMMHEDAISYLPGDILCKVDRAAMAVSLETRVPFLDHRVAEVAARIPVAMQIRGGVGKILLRKLLARLAPPVLFERPKAGFAVPVGDWIRGPLRDWAEDLLDPSRLRDQGYFDADKIGRRWRDHLSGRMDATQAIWTILMFQSWIAAQDASSSPEIG